MRFSGSEVLIDVVIEGRIGMPRHLQIGRAVLEGIVLDLEAIYVREIQPIDAIAVAKIVENGIVCVPTNSTFHQEGSPACMPGWIQ